MASTNMATVFSMGGRQLYDNIEQVSIEPFEIHLHHVYNKQLMFALWVKLEWNSDQYLGNKSVKFVSFITNFTGNKK